MAESPRRESLVRAIFPGLELRDEAGTNKPILRGHFSVFNQWAPIRSSWEGNFYERIAPGAFAKTFKENASRIRVLLEHGKDPDLGNKPIGKIQELREDETGAYYEVGLFDGIPPLVLDGLRAGAYGASFRFSVVNDDYVERPKRSSYNPEGLPERTIKEAKVAEFGPVCFGAYDGATAGIRSMTDRFLFDALTEDPERLRALIDEKKSRTITTSSPTTRVVFTSRSPEPEVAEERMDTEDLDCLAQMIQLGADYIAEQDEPDDQPNIPKMEAILASLTELVPVEVAEQEPADEPEDEENSAHPDGEARTDLEPEPSAATTPPGQTEPERPVATTRAETSTSAGLFIPQRKDTPKWQLK